MGHQPDYQNKLFVNNFNLDKRVRKDHILGDECEWGSRMQLETKLFNQWAGPGEFVPVAILFSPIWKARTFRLWQLSENPKHGKVRVSKEAEQAFFETVKRLPPGGC
jgi:hypothetical protein